MSNPNANQRPARQIRGPQSALTDFLASHNINANQIRQDANARRAAALATQQTTESESNASDAASAPAPAPIRAAETRVQTSKRKKEEEKAIAKIKASKQFKRSRRQYGSDEEMTDEDQAARAIYAERGAPLPDQVENCEICDKRFTVTPYSRKGEDGGLLCPKCTRNMDKEEGAERKRRKTASSGQRRKVQSGLLDGIYPGAKDLMTLCIEALARNAHMAEDLGDLPPTMVDKLAAILSKKRILNSSTLDLFLRVGFDRVSVYDSALLNSDDYIRIFQYAPTIKHLRLKNGVQFKNKVMDHLLATNVKLETLSIHGANLISDDRWDRFLTEKGSDLGTLQVYYTDGHFGDEQLELLGTTCPNLRRLKVSHNQKVTDEGIAHIAKLASLEHLTLEIYKPTSSIPYVQILDNIGPNLRTFCLGTVHHIDDTVLTAIHKNCQHLNKLRISDNEVLTDSGFASLFTNWHNTPLTYIDLHKCRHLDASDPRSNPQNIGLGSLGFEAMMSHSSKNLKHLNIHSCRHISVASFERAFAPGKVYPELQKINISFCQSVNDFVVGCIFKACPNLKMLIVFGNFGVKDVKVPKGKILIGVPNALGMQIEGTEDGEGRVI